MHVVRQRSLDAMQALIGVLDRIPKDNPLSGQAEKNYIRGPLAEAVDVFLQCITDLTQCINNLRKYVKDNSTGIFALTKKSQRDTAEAWMKTAEEYRIELLDTFKEVIDPYVQWIGDIMLQSLPTIDDLLEQRDQLRNQ